MKKEAKIFAALLVCALSAVLLTGCSGSSGADITPLVGTWLRTESDMEVTYIINADGTYTQHNETTSGIAISIDDSGTFTYDGKTLTLTSADFGTDYSYEVSFSGGTMYWDSGSKVLEYNKK